MVILAIVFFVVCLVIGLSLFVITMVNLHNENAEKNPVTSTTKVTAKKSFEFPQISIDPVTVTVALVIMWIVWSGYKHFFGEVKTTPVVQNATVRTVNYSPQPSNVYTYGTLSWVKPGNVSGRDSELRSLSSRVKILKHDSNEFSFIQYYEYEGETKKAHFSWKSGERYGTWHQEYPEDGGNWCLKQTGENSWQGWETDQSGVPINLRLDLETEI